MVTTTFFVLHIGSSFIFQTGTLVLSHTAIFIMHHVFATLHWKPLKNIKIMIICTAKIIFTVLLLIFFVQIIALNEDEYCTKDGSCLEQSAEQFSVCSKQQKAPCTCENSESIDILSKNFKTEKWTPVGTLPIEVFSAFLDPRDWKQPKTVQKPDKFLTVRVIAHGLQAVYNTVPPVYCSTVIGDKILNLGKGDYVRIYVSTAHHDEYTAHFILCYLPEQLRTVSTVSLSSSQCGHFDNSVTLPVIYSNPLYVGRPSDKDIKLGICVSPIYGYKPLHLAEFVENHRILGVEKFTFYIHKASEDLRKLLEFYESEKVAQLVDWPLDMGRNYFYFDQRSALNDCLYRNYGKVTYAGFVDLDEVMAPRSHSDLQELVHQLTKEKENLASICFQHVYFQLNETDPKSKYDPPFKTQTKFSRTTEIYPAGKIRSKCMHSPANVVATDIHSAQWWLNDSMQEIFLPEKLGILQHYRQYKFEKMIKEQELFKFVNDYFLLRFRAQLTGRVNRILRAIDLT